MSDPRWNSWIIELRSRLSAPTGKRLPPTDARQAAVLVPLYVNAGELWLLMTRRADSLPHHKGQIAFPGGSLEAGEDHWTAALRETHEELGIEPPRILRIGQLDEIETPSGFRIVPCVGAVPFPVATALDKGEVEELVPLPITAFADPAAIEERIVIVDGDQQLVRLYHIGTRPIWGVTARIVQNLLVRLGLEPDEEVAN